MSAVDVTLLKEALDEYMKLYYEAQRTVNSEFSGSIGNDDEMLRRKVR